MVQSEHDVALTNHEIIRDANHRLFIVDNMGRRAIGAEIGPNSLIGRYFDNRTAFTGLSGGELQLMYPGLGAGVVEHSDFFDDPWDRIERSLPWIYGVVFDGKRAGDTGKTVRSFHTGIHGVDQKGRGYNALDPETFWWAHATFFDMTVRNADEFSHNTLSPTDRAKMYNESLTWYERYGMPMRDVPTDYWSFYDKFNGICDNVLELTPAAEIAVEKALTHDGERLPMIPKEIWPIIKPPAGALLGRLAIGGLPERVRQRFDIPFPATEKIQYDLFSLAVRTNWWMVPDRLRYHPRAYEGVRRERISQDKSFLKQLHPRSVVNRMADIASDLYKDFS